MPVTNATPIVAIRILLALVVILVTGFWGFMTLLSDIAAADTRLMWGLRLLGAHAIAGFLVGVLLPLRWRLGLGASWGAVLFGCGGVVTLLSPQTADASAAVTLADQLTATAFALLAIPGAITLSAYSGSRLMTTNAV